MEDVARIAGVSLITVSRALNGGANVTAATRARVEAAVRQTGYVPNLIAGGLASNRSRIVGLVVPTITNSIFAATVQGLSDVMEPEGYSILLGQSGYDDARERILIATMVGRRVEGLLIVGGSQPPEVRDMLRGSGVAVVQAWELAADPIDLTVGFSNFAAGRAITEHLIARGHRRIAFLGGGDPRGAARGAGFAAAMAAAGLEPISLHAPSPASIAAGRAVARELIAARPRVEAAFCATDVFAVGVLAECRRAGIAVPAELAVAGFGDLEVAQHLAPALTTVRIRDYAIGAEAARLLLGTIAGQPRARASVDLGFEIVLREST